MENFEYQKDITPSGGVIIETPEGVVLVREKQENFTRFFWGHKTTEKTFYKLPGGKFNFSKDKNIKDTAVREVLEETGINLFGRQSDLIFINVIFRKGYRHCLFYIYLPEVPILKPGFEIKDIIILSPEEWREKIIGNDILIWHAKAVEDYLPEFQT